MKEKARLLKDQERKQNLLTAKGKQSLFAESLNKTLEMNKTAQTPNPYQTLPSKMGQSSKNEIQKSLISDLNAQIDGGISLRRIREKKKS
jgi:hypothetical protein